MRTFSIRLATAVLMVAATTIGCAAGSGDDAASRAGRINPTPFRAEIEALERVLYKTSPPDYGDAEAAASLLRRLHERVSGEAANPVIRGRVDEILFLASLADGGDTGYALPDLGPTRERWEQIRAAVFAPADWFASGGDEIVSAQTRPAPTVTLQEVHELTLVIGRIERLVADGRRQCDELGEPQYSIEAPGAAGRAQIEGWRRWAREWDDAVNGVAAHLPPAPAWDGEPNYAVAYQEIERAIRELRLVPGGAGDWPTPFRYSWEQRFTAAGRALRAARESLSVAVRK